MNKYVQIIRVSMLTTGTTTQVPHTRARAHTHTHTHTYTHIRRVSTVTT